MKLFGMYYGVPYFNIASTEMHVRFAIIDGNRYKCVKLTKVYEIKILDKLFSRQ